MFDVLAAAVIAMAPADVTYCPADNVWSSSWHQCPPVTDEVYSREVGDDNADGRIDEDESGFDCRVMGNLRCGQGATLPGGSLAIPGDYSNPNCWPGATYCPPSDSPPDWTATDGEGNPVPPLAVGPNALDAGTYVGEYN